MTFPIRISMDAKLSVYENSALRISRKDCLIATGIGEESTRYKFKKKTFSMRNFFYNISTSS